MTSKARKNSNSRASAYKLHWRGELSDFITDVVWSPTGEHLAVSSSNGEVGLWQESGLVSLQTGQSDSAINRLGFSADGRYLAAAGQQGDVLIWSLQTPQQAPIVLTNPHSWIDQLSWHPVEPWLAFGVGNQVQIWDIPQAKPLTQLEFAASSVLSLDWHPQGHLLAASGHTGVKVWSQDNWATDPEFIEVPGASIAVAWSTDGRYLASGNLDRTLTVVSWGNPPPWLMQGFPGKVRQVSWAAPISDAPSMVAAACIDGVTIWQRQDNGWESQVLQHHSQTVGAIAFHPTIRLLASAAQDGHLCLWQNATKLQQTLKGVTSGFSTIKWHPEGSYLAAGGDQGEILIWKPVSRGKGFQ